MKIIERTVTETKEFTWDFQRMLIKFIEEWFNNNDAWHDENQKERCLEWRRRWSEKDLRAMIQQELAKQTGKQK